MKDEDKLRKEARRRARAMWWEKNGERFKGLSFTLISIALVVGIWAGMRENVPARPPVSASAAAAGQPVKAATPARADLSGEVVVVVKAPEVVEVLKATQEAAAIRVQNDKLVGDLKKIGEQLSVEQAKVASLTGEKAKLAEQIQKLKIEFAKPAPPAPPKPVVAKVEPKKVCPTPPAVAAKAPEVKATAQPPLCAKPAPPAPAVAQVPLPAAVQIQGPAYCNPSVKVSLKGEQCDGALEPYSTRQGNVVVSGCKEPIPLMLVVNARGGLVSGVEDPRSVAKKIGVDPGQLSQAWIHGPTGHTLNWVVGKKQKEPQQKIY